MENESGLCEQCGKEIELSGFELSLEQGIKRFCCEGCLSIYQLVYLKLISTIIDGEKKMKACESCSDRVNIGCNHKKMSVLSRAVGLLFIYLPILTLPFVITSAYLTYFSLKLVGAENVKKWGDFLPDRASHRYDLKSQITMDGSFKLSFAQSKLYWILNCTWYCPYSVGLFEWHAYMVKVVENWWCPFNHDRKNSYTDGAIDQSFWHIYPEEKIKLHEDDKNNVIFNQDVSDKKD